MGFFSRGPKFWTDTLVICYSDLDNAKDWWIRTFGCTQAPLPEWDDPLPSDVALTLPGLEEPTILLSDKAEELQEFGAARPKDRPMVFCDKLERAIEHLKKKGAAPGVPQTQGARFIEILDPEGNSIEVCETP